MENRLSKIEERIEKIEEASNLASPEVEQIQFGIRNLSLDFHEKLTIRSSGNIQYWREFQVPEGWTRYSNWSVTVKIRTKKNKPAKCDWIKITDCNHRIKQAATVVEKSSISFTTPKTKGWKDMKYKVQIKHDGIIHNPVSVKLRR